MYIYKIGIRSHGYGGRAVPSSAVCKLDTQESGSGAKAGGPAELEAHISARVQRPQSWGAAGAGPGLNPKPVNQAVRVALSEAEDGHPRAGAAGTHLSSAFSFSSGAHRIG